MAKSVILISDMMMRRGMCMCMCPSLACVCSLG